MTSRLGKSIGIVVTNTAVLLNSSINKKLQPFGIAIEQRAILEIIMNKGCIKQTELTTILCRDRTTISRTLKTLENKDYIKKEKIDNKIFMIKLSEKGIDVMEKTQDIVNEFRNNILSNFTEDEIDNLYAYLEKIQDIVKE
ncbi:MarR family winged helix-turn-helix transcriptional regulator [Arcobacter arenosus]|uniref:MarR family transcriptional regulator n=1 Tax=Arcobacter arenosus TaxID=2576037 RepID=A0A5R8Y024_9BACT|nr:MarR family transcriptional regulator [Arcobacter arenosus]TLP37735.1 MarR family transcriptional regulator [Arcobacter arenosus]